MGLIYLKRSILFLLRTSQTEKKHSYEYHYITRIVEYDFAPYQPEQQTSVAGVDTYQFSHKDDWIAGFNPEKGNVTYLDPFIAKGTSHSLSSFEEEIYNLKEGRYIFENGKFIYVGSPKY